MTDIDILLVVQLETQVAHSVMKLQKPVNAIFARYVAMIMMHEEGVSNKRIAEWFCMKPTNVSRALKTIDNLLISNKTFKKMYLACIQRMAEMEDAA